MKKFKKLISLALAFAMIVAYMPVIAADDTGNSVDITNVSFEPGKNNFYVVFGKTADSIRSNKMTYYDGMAQGVTDSNDRTWSEPFEMDGVPGRKVYNANRVYLKLDETKFDSANDHRFMVLITYYDFGPDVGHFYFDYPSTKGGTGRYDITKPGITPKWTTESFIISDADFTGKLANGADVEIVTGAYNAFAKIEIINIADIENSGESLEIPTVNNIQAEALSMINLYDSKDEDGNSYGLEETMTRAELLEAIVKVTGHADEIAGATPSTSFTDISGRTAKVVAVAEKYNLVKGSYGKFYPDRLATVREMLTFGMRYIGYDHLPDLYDTSYDLAVYESLVLPNNFIIFVDKPLIRDNLVAFMFNMLATNGMSSTKTDLLIVELMNRDIITGEMLKATGNPTLASYEYYSPQPCPKILINDAKSGESYWYVNFNGKKMIRPYVTAQGFNYDGTKFIFANDGTQAMYEYDIVNETVRFLDFTDNCATSLNAVVTPDDIIYYNNKSNETWKMDWKTYKKERVWTGKYSVPNVTNDGEWISGYGGDSDKVYRTNLETGESETLPVPVELWKQNPTSTGKGHPIINPVYPELVFFCNEGTTSGIPDRLWLARFDTGDVYNMFIQAGEEGSFQTQETSGHEVWSMDGEYMYWVKYTYAQNLGQSGLMRTDKYGNTREYLNGDYKHWHCYPSSDHNWIASDTTDAGRVVLTNANTYESHLIATFNNGNANHPYQPHPHISFNNKMISWQLVHDGVLGVGIYDMSKFTDNTVANEKIAFNDEITLISNADSNYIVEESEFEGEKCFEVKQNNYLFVDVNDDYEFGDDKDVKVAITYLDYGRQPIQLKYTQIDTSDRTQLANRENVAINSPAKQDVKQWRTVIYELDGASLSNRGQHGSDFMLFSPLSQMLVKDIRIVQE